MKAKDIKETKITFIGSNKGYYHHEGLTDYTQYNIKVIDALHIGKETYEKEILKVRSLPYHSEEQKSLKQNLPTFMVGGTWTLKNIKDEDVVSISNLMVIDIDKQDNEDKDLNEYKHILFNLPYVFAVFNSSTGTGIKVIILVEDGRYTSDYYKYISNLWKYKFNIICDNSAHNIGRKCFVFIDDDILIKDDEEEIQSWKLKSLELPREEQLDMFKILKCDTINDIKTKYTKSAIDKVINKGYYAETYCSWYYAGCDLANFEDGERLFYLMSKNYPENDTDVVINKKWKECLKNPTIINDEFHKKWQGIAKRLLGEKWWLNN